MRPAGVFSTIRLRAWSGEPGAGREPNRIRSQATTPETAR